MKDYIQGDLFPDFEPTHPKSVDNNSTHSDENKRERQLLNLHLHNGFPTEGIEGLPLLSPYNGPLPNDLISFSDRNKMLYSYGIHCYLYDYKFEQTWSNPSTVVPCLQKYKCVIGPDFSIFVDQPRAINVWNVYRNRWVTSYWQNQSVRAIPSASWGRIDSFDYCFDGLPCNSIIAVGHTAIGKDRSYRRLYRLGIETLIQRKNPTKLLVYEAPLDFTPKVEVVYYEGKIQKLRNNGKKNH